MSAQWDRIKEIYLAALGLPQQSRREYVVTATEGNASLREAVEELLHWGNEAPQFDSPIRLKDYSGRTFGHYKILEEFGRGGMGVVYKAQDTLLGRTVVLKFLAPEVMANPEFRERFLNEAKAAAAFDHPNICTLYGIEEHEGVTFLVMSYVDGKTLKERMKARPIPVDEALRIATDTARGLREAHRKGVVHRDVKPSNILLAGGRRAVITDFGLAQFAGEARMTKHGDWMGTPAYMSPEQIRGTKATPASDIWSLGVVLYEMLAGRLPFPEANIPALVLAIQEANFAPITSVCPDLPAAVERVLHRMLARNPEDRLADGGAAVWELANLSDAAEAGEPPPQVKKNAGRPAKALVVAAAVGAILLAAFLVSRPRPAAPEDRAVIPLSTYAGIEDSPSFSPDGAQVVFSWHPEESRNSEICVKALREEKLHCLTTDPRPDFAPAWSPDGRWIAFQREVKPGIFEIYIVSPLGGEERRLAELSGRYGKDNFSKMAWTPESGYLVYSDQTAGKRQMCLWILSMETLERRPLTTAGEKSMGDRSPAISRDGRQLAFVREGELFGDLWVQPLGAGYMPDGDPRRMAIDNQFLVDPVWTPDGSEILFGGSEAAAHAGMRIWRVDVSGTKKPVVIDAITEGAHSPAISPDGRTLAFTRFQNDQNIWRIDRESVTTPWQAPRKFIEISSTRDEGLPSISPDGKSIAFVSNRGGGFDVWVSNRDGSNVRQRTFIGALSGTVAWSPDSRKIAFDRYMNGNWDVYLVGADAGQLRQLTHDPTNETVDTWSNDGKHIYINSTRTQDVQIWKVPATGGAAVQVTRNGGYFGIESPDGKYLYYTLSWKDGPLRRLTLNSNEDIEILKSVQALCFAVTSRGIFFMPAGRELALRNDIDYLDLGSGKVSSVLKSHSNVTQSISVSSDELMILFAQRDQLGSDLMMLTNFR